MNNNQILFEQNKAIADKEVETIPDELKDQMISERLRASPNYFTNMIYF